MRQVSSPICAEEYWVGKGYLFLGLWIRIIPSSVKAKSVWPFQQNLAEQMWGDDRNRCKLAWRLEKGHINSRKEDKMKKVHVHLFSSSSSSSSVSCLLLYCPGNIRVVWYLQQEQDTTTIVIDSMIWWSESKTWWSYLPVTLSQTTTLLWSAATTNLIDCRKWQFDTSLGLTNWSLNIWNFSRLTIWSLIIWNFSRLKIWSLTIWHFSRLTIW